MAAEHRNPLHVACRQLQLYPQIQEPDGVKFSFWLVLLDVELLADEDLPFVRCSMTVINRVDRNRDSPSSASCNAAC